MINSIEFADTYLRILIDPTAEGLRTATKDLNSNQIISLYNYLQIYTKDYSTHSIEEKNRVNASLDEASVKKYLEEK